MKFYRGRKSIKVAALLHLTFIQKEMDLKCCAYIASYQKEIKVSITT